MSYAATDISLNPFTENHNFFRNLPSDLFLNYARFALLARFNWYSVGVLSSEDSFHVKVGPSLIRKYKVVIQLHVRIHVEIGNKIGIRVYTHRQFYICIMLALCNTIKFHVIFSLQQATEDFIHMFETMDITVFNGWSRIHFQ